MASVNEKSFATFPPSSLEELVFGVATVDAAVAVVTLVDALVTPVNLLTVAAIISDVGG